MWHLLIAAAVAGSTGFAANRFLKLKSTASNTKPSISSLPIPQQTLPRNAVTPCPVENADLTIPQNFHETAIDNNNTDTQNKVFTFTSSKSPKKYGSPSQPKRYLNKPARVRRWSKAGIRVAKVELRSAALEHSNSGKKLLKKRKTNNHIAGNTAFCSPKDSSLFGWGVSFGIMCMMAGKAEISELNKTMSETTKVIQELKSELKRKSMCAHRMRDSIDNTGAEFISKMNGRDNEIMVKKISSELNNSDVIIWSQSVNEGECGSSALTEEPNQQALEMDQLETELEFEIQKLPGYTIDTNCQGEIRPKLDEIKVPNEGCHETDDLNFNSSQNQGILASELNQKLSQLLIEQQENHIADMESELNLAQSRLQEKEAELQALKDCVRRLTQLPLSTSVSDDETESHKGTDDWEFNIVDSELKQPVIGVKRPIGL